MLRPNGNYLERQVLEGSPLEHLILLYGKALNSLKLAKNAIESGLNDPDTVKTKVENLSKAMDILIYLQAILDLEKGGEIAKNLKEIYQTLIQALLEVNFSNNLKPLNDSIEILEKLRNAWMEIKPLQKTL
ncbi:MAG: flagellar export chaperone FliS [Caldimicrobium sp.]|jgi:flagellar protein FliS|uniref:Flagellar secretion chaperone FliS n=1 Tax=Caldimicrobium thiodismutans TaxID=1653476 RepID=A0A2N7PKP1_9BACT|nr:MAG: flagellar export chaperone FliS [Caldimicrobium thiodismutans]